MTRNRATGTCFDRNMTELGQTRLLTKRRSLPVSPDKRISLVGVSQTCQVRPLGDPAESEDVGRSFANRI